MNTIEVNGLDIQITQKIVGISLRNPHSVERTTTGIKWNGSVDLLGESGRISNRGVSSAIYDNSEMTFEALNVVAQAEFSKDYLELTVGESQTAQGKLMATTMISAINENDTGINIEDINELVTAIITALI